MWIVELHQAIYFSIDPPLIVSCVPLLFILSPFVAKIFVVTSQRQSSHVTSTQLHNAYIGKLGNTYLVDTIYPFIQTGLS